MVSIKGFLTTLIIRTVKRESEEGGYNSRVMDQLSYLTLQLVRICKRYQRKAMARDTVISALLDDAPEVRAALTQTRAVEMLTSADDAASQIVDHEFSELEQALLEGADFRPALRAYLDENL
jgi:hypothetical protein